jgi:hypothetical protein
MDNHVQIYIRCQNHLATQGLLQILQTFLKKICNSQAKLHRSHTRGCSNFDIFLQIQIVHAFLERDWIHNQNTKYFCLSVSM